MGLITVIVQNFCNTGVDNVYLFLKWTVYILLAAARSLWRQGEAQSLMRSQPECMKEEAVS